MRSYPSLFALGHRALRDLALDPVLIEEKVDGSQFSFGVIGGEILCRSKGKLQDVNAPDKMFNKATEAVKWLAPSLVPGWTYRGEYLATPRHNVQTHDRTPVMNIIIFDIDRSDEDYLNYDEKKAEAERLGLEVVPRLFEGELSQVNLDELLATDSILGGTKIEGVVIKNYKRFGVDKKILIAKFVSARFKEVHKKLWGESNPRGGDILERVVARYKTEARWAKAVHHLRDDGKILGEPKDIALLVPEIQRDVLKEEGEAIKDELFKWAWPHIARGIVNGAPQWYKDKLAAEQPGLTDAA